MSCENEFLAPIDDAIARCPSRASDADSSRAENVKHFSGAKKPPLGLIPPAFSLELALALAFGARNYDKNNWRRDIPIRASTYVSAMRRHLDAWESGEDRANDSNVSHLAHLAASCAIILDAVTAGRFTDDREFTDYQRLVDDASTRMEAWPPAKFDVV